MSFQTHTSTNTSTSLTIATIALLAAGGLALAALPLGKNKIPQSSSVLADGQKCGVNTFSVSSSCGKHAYRHASITCYDGSVHNLGGKTSCKGTDAWQDLAHVLCAATCEAPIYCEDTDGGYFIDEQGTVSSDSGEFTDSCDDAMRVREYLCVTNELGEDVYTVSPTDCEFGCRDGACLEEPLHTATVTSSAQLAVNWGIDSPERFLRGDQTVAIVHIANGYNYDIEIDVFTFALFSDGLVQEEGQLPSSSVSLWNEYEERLGSSEWSINSDNTVRFTGDIIPAGMTKTYELRANIIHQIEEDGFLSVAIPEQGIAWTNLASGEEFVYGLDLERRSLISYN